MMARSLLPSQQKLAEKLTILNDRGIGMLTRIYNIKKACGDSKSKPSFLSDKSLESAIKHVIRRFPNVDTRGTTNSQLNAVYNIRQEIMKSLSLYYYTFVDLLDFKDHVCELLTTMDACQIQLDISINFDLTKGYLDLTITYVSLMILLSQVEDRKAVLGLFNAAHEMTHGQSDSSFPRLGQLIVDYDPPMKKLSEEFIPHAKLLFQAVMSLQQVLPRRNVTADDWRKGQLLSLVSNPTQMLNPAQTETMACEYLPLETMERWVIFGLMLIHPYLNQPQAADLLTKALHGGWVVTLFRDEVILIHSYIQTFFEGIKGYNKKVAEIKESYNHVLQTATLLHRERRKFLRTALKELGLIITDQPGLLGPKALLVFIGLSLARDEIHWLLRHSENLPLRQAKGRSQVEDLVDRQLPELLFHLEELRALVRKYNQVIQRYYIQYLCAYDALMLNDLIQTMTMMPDEDANMLASICNAISNVSIKQVEENELFDFRGLRLDWFRLQAYTSISKYSFNLFDQRNLAVLLNTIVFHTKMVDFLDQMITETSDLSIFCFFSKQFEEQFHMCLEFPAQTRYIVAFPLMCAHFMNCTHELCPEERHHIGDRSLTMVNAYLEEMSREAKNIITTICDEQCLMSDKLLPKHCAPQIAHAVNKKKRDKKNKVLSEPDKQPGLESYRKSREELTTMDKLHMALTELCHAINYCNTIHVWDHTFAPREYLTQHLESRFNKALVGMVMYNADNYEIAKPSELLTSVRSYMNVLQSIENYVHIDVTRVFNNVLLQQTQAQDSHGEKTITALYTNWYSEVLLRKVSVGPICFSKNHRAFVTITSEGQLPFSAEEYSDINELRALAELIGPYGMKFLNESLMWYITSQVTELKKLVVLNKDLLITLRSNYDKPELMKELFKKLLRPKTAQNVDNILQRMTIIGVILGFRSLAQDALNDVLMDRIPFLLSSIVDFKHNIPNADSMVVTEMASAAGLTCKVDPALVSALRAQKTDLGEDEYQVTCLLMVFVAVSLPKLARNEGSYYKAALEGHLNNIHCLALAINGIAGALFTICGHGDTEERLKEFLALASSSLLRLGQETDREALRNRESVYLLLDLIVQESPFLTMDLLESCFPYALLRNAYHAVYRPDNVLVT